MATSPPIPDPQADDALAREAIEIAERLLKEALRQQTAAEKKDAAKLGRMMEDPRGKAFTFAMVDEVFRSRDAGVSARRWRGLLDAFGLPRFLNGAERLLIHLGAFGSRVMPGPVMKAVERRMRADSARVILPGEEAPLRRHLARRAAEGFRINLNQLGEAVLGEEEAARRLEAVLDRLADPAVDYVSVKISAIFSQINLVA